MTAYGRRAFEIVDAFEDAVSQYTGALEVVAVDSCTNALFLALQYERLHGEVDWGARGRPWCRVPKKTYVGVAQAVKNAGYLLQWEALDWAGTYTLAPTLVVDAAKRFTAGMYQPSMLMCVSFQAYKHLPIGRGGAILTDDADAARWMRRARFDGRDPWGNEIDQPGWHMYMTPPDAARGLWLMHGLAHNNPDLPNEHVDVSGHPVFQ